MSYEEKRTWAYLVTSAAAYLVYLVIIVGRVRHTPVAQVPYAAVLLWSCVAAMVASMIGQLAVETARPSDSLPPRAAAGGMTQPTS